MRIKSVVLAAVAVAVLAGCYRVTVTYGPQPAANAATVVDYPWQHSWVFGLVPPPEINVGERCPEGVSRVETKVSFLNGLASALVGAAVDGLVRSSNDSLYIGVGAAGLWQPLSAKVTCAPR
ncbi:MAG: Bor/Iss family lipoprotein [Gemmatimonadaceae bacterium]